MIRAFNHSRRYSRRTAVRWRAMKYGSENTSVLSQVPRKDCELHTATRAGQCDSVVPFTAAHRGEGCACVAMHVLLAPL